MIAIRNDSKTNDLDSLFHPCGRGLFDQHADSLFYFYLFFDFAPKPTRVGDE